MKMFRIFTGITLAMLFVFTSTTTLSAANDKKSKKESSRSKKKKDTAKAPANPAEKVEIDPNNPFRHKLKRLERYKADLAETSSPNRQKRLKARIKKYQDDIKKDHAEAVEMIKRKIQARENDLKFQTHKPFREPIEKEIEKLKNEIKQLNEWAGIKEDKGKAPAAAKKAK